MIRFSLIVVMTMFCLCSGCASSALAPYPLQNWPALSAGVPCEKISGSYINFTEDLWPIAAVRAGNAKPRAALASFFTTVSPPTRPENLWTVERVEIDVSSRQVILYGAWKDQVSLDAWQCLDDGSLMASIERKAYGEQTFDARVRIRLELRQAADRSLIVHMLEQFSDLSVKGLTRESWFRFLPAPAP